MVEGERDEWRERALVPADDMDVERKRPADWPHWPDRGNGPMRRDRLERRLFRDSEREAEIERTQAVIREIEIAAEAKSAEIERLEQRLNGSAPPVEPAPARAATATFVALVCSPSGYSLRTVEGHAPEPGENVTVEGVEHVVAKLARSPLPGDERRCAYLEP
ncbi:MAG TPA: hypothetical protein VLJ76_06760 [Gaiellaceae bacterium]|nr:hypothetical protein [Gaiellaceae bacterium]